MGSLVWGSCGLATKWNASGPKRVQEEEEEDDDDDGDDKDDDDGDRVVTMRRIR